MKILLWLYKSKIDSKDLIPIMMRITLNGERVNFPTHINIEEKAWDITRQSIKGSNELIKKYNQHLFMLRTRAWDYYSEAMKKNRVITANQVKQYVLGVDAIYN